MKNKIVVISDPHIGVKSSWKMLPNGLSVRTIDNIKRFNWIIRSINKEETALVIIAGDFFDRLTISPTIMTLSLKIIKFLSTNNIGVIIIGGNHDSTANLHKKEAIDIVGALPNCLIFRGFASVNFPTGKIIGYYKGKKHTPKFNAWFKENVIPNLAKKSVGIALFPFLSMRGIADLYYGGWIEENTKKPFDGSATRDNLNSFMRTLVEMMKDSISNCNNKIAIGHYQLFGSSLHANSEPIVLQREMVFTRQMIDPDAWDLIAFGHIHLPQPVWGTDKNPENLHKVQHIGACEKLRFDEKDDHRRYLIYDCDTKRVSEVSLDPNPSEPNRPQVRPMLEKSVDIPLGDPDPVNTVISEVFNSYDSDLLASANVKIIVNIHVEDRVKFDRRKVREKLEQSVFFLDRIVVNFIRNEREEDYRNVKERKTIDLPSLLDMFLGGINIKGETLKIESIEDKIKKEAHEILGDAIKRRR